MISPLPRPILMKAKASRAKNNVDKEGRLQPSTLRYNPDNRAHADTRHHNMAELGALLYLTLLRGQQRRRRRRPGRGEGAFVW